MTTAEFDRIVRKLEYMQARYARRKAAGLCAQCPRPATRGVKCEECAEKARVCMARIRRLARSKPGGQRFGARP